VLRKSAITELGECYEGKVRDTYSSGKERIIITTDRLSAFDVVLSCIPFKGAVLNKIATTFLNATKNIVPNHLLESPHPNVMVVRDCKVIPIEVVVRAYLAGSAWRDYKAGKTISGVSLPSGMKEFQKLHEPIVTPSTKAAIGLHDTPISEKEIIEQKIVSAEVWNFVRTKALEVFRYGAEQAQSRGLILVDTKFEFGIVGDEVLLIDEILTLDSSRYWVEATYVDLISRGESPEMLDKEPTRRWLLSQGFSGEGPIPTITEDHIVSLATHYISACERITGEPFKCEVGDPIPGIKKALGILS